MKGALIMTSLSNSTTDASVQQLVQYVTNLNCPDYVNDELKKFLDSVTDWRTDVQDIEKRLAVKLAYDQLRQTVKLQVYNYHLPMQVLHDFEDLCRDLLD